MREVPELASYLQIEERELPLLDLQVTWCPSHLESRASPSGLRWGGSSEPLARSGFDSPECSDSESYRNPEPVEHGLLGGAWRHAVADRVDLAGVVAQSFV